MMSAMSIGMYYTSPMIAIYYFMSTQHQINVTYYMFVYYFTGNFIFGFMMYNLLVMSIDRPIVALTNLRKDIKDAEENPDYRLDTYLENFRASEFENVDGDWSGSE